MITYGDATYVRVSEVLKEIEDFSGIYPHILERKAKIGTEVHCAIQNYMLGEFPIYGPECEGYMDSFIKWHTRLAPELVHCEQRFFDPLLKLTGCVDAIARIPGNPLPSLIDFKTSAQEAPIKWPMQAHLYYHLAKSAGIDLDPTFLFIKLDKHGNNPQVFRYEFNSSYMRKCLDLVDKFWEKNREQSDFLEDVVGIF